MSWRLTQACRARKFRSEQFLRRKREALVPATARSFMFVADPPSIREARSPHPRLPSRGYDGYRHR